ncbi:MAG: 4Fe-4S dicluster domain-containing protein [Deltaproteobacteria bacterium]|nr:4Fe-4S dicluster domain-containing protein [Deltaproteobacteria bacterium]
MHPTWMLTMLVGLFAAFCWSANRRWQLLKVGRDDNRLDQLGERLKGTYEYAFVQKKMSNYAGAGLAHQLIFVGFLVLLLRSLILWGRGFDPTFNLWIFGPTPVNLPLLGPVPIGTVYGFAKDVVSMLVLLGALYFLYLRVYKNEARLTHSFEAVLILGIIISMMLGDMLYDGAAEVLHKRYWASLCGPGGDVDTCASITTVVSHLGAMPTAAETHFAWHAYPDPAGSLFALVLGDSGHQQLIAIAHVGFWVHATLVMLFLNLLPHSKHFHILTGIPNVFARSLEHPGKLSSMGNTEQLGELVMAAADSPDTAAPVGVARIEHFTWKAILDFYTCTECGRCSDHCPAHRSGKLLSPKQFTIDLRDHLYAREDEFIRRPGGPKGAVDDGHAHGAHGHDAHGHDAHGHDAHGHDAHGHDDHGHDDHHEPVYPENPIPLADVTSEPIDLVGNVIHPDVLWACTTCRACEEQCPVMISYVDKIVDMRRNLVMVKGEFPVELAGPFQGMEVNGNPWNLARLDRGNWAEGLDVPTMADFPDAPVLFWVGCAASYDDRAKKIARSTARLMKAAGVEFAILGQEETCTGDPARRAGNEYLFAQLAEQNAATLNGYKEQGGITKIVTSCPHCFNTIANEYPDFGAKFEVVHHSEYLMNLVDEKKLFPREKHDGKVVYHDACYLGRYNDKTEEPRRILQSIPGAELVEVLEASRKKGLCCGAGGMQMFMEEQNKDRMNNRRTLQLLDTGAKTIATGCPFCITMISDGLKAHNQEDSVRTVDVAEMLEESCALDKPVGRRAAMPQDPPRRSPAAGHAAE